MLSLITYFLYVRECKILSITLYMKIIFQIKILKQWKVGNGFVDLRS